MPTFDAIQQEIAAMLDVADEDLTEEQKSAMDAYLDELAQAEADKVDAFAGFIRQETARTKFLKEESARLASKARTAENRIAYLKARYLTIMQQAGVRKIQGHVYALSIRSTPTVQVDDPAALDDFYCRFIPARREPDKRVILEALRDGGTLPGCRLVHNESLQIR